MKMEKGFKCPRYLKRWSMDRESMRILMRANLSFSHQHRESLKSKKKEDK